MKRMSMDDFIPRSAVLAKSYFHGKHSTWDNPFADGCMAIDEADIWDIPAADVVEVVRCRECQFNTTEKKCLNP